MRANTIERIKEMLESNSVKNGPKGCWIYQAGSRDHTGHCKIRYGGKWRQIHRLSAHIHWGFDMDSDILILHRVYCAYPNCWNPEHLYEGNQKDNVRDSIVTGTHVTTNPDIPNSQGLKTHCPHGHLLDGITTTQRYCKTCNKERTKKRRAEEKKEDDGSPVSILSE